MSNYYKEIMIVEDLEIMTDKESIKDIMKKIKIMQEYKDIYGEADINEYVALHGTYKGIDDYLIQKMDKRKDANENNQT